jgi:hypothetical protein
MEFGSTVATSPLPYQRLPILPAWLPLGAAVTASVLAAASVFDYRIAIAAGGFIIFGCLAFASPQLGLLVLVCYVEIVAGLVKNWTGGSTLAAASVDGLALVLLAAGLVRFGVPAVRTTLDRLLLLFVVLVLVMAVANPNSPHGLQLLGGVRTLALYVPFYFYARYFAPTGKAQLRLIVLIVVGAAVLGMVSVIQDVIGPASSVRLHLLNHATFDFATTHGGFRPASLLPLPNVAGIFFAASSLLALAVILRPGETARLPFLLALPWTLAGMALSGQRTAIGAFMVALLVMAVLARSTFTIGLVLVVVAVVLESSLLSLNSVAIQRVTQVGTTSSVRSTESRLRTWNNVLAQLPSFPLGHGPGYTGSSAYRFGSTTGPTSYAIRSDNYFVKLLWELGIPGALWYVTFAIAIATAAILAAIRGTGGNYQFGGLFPWLSLGVAGMVIQQGVAANFTNVLDPSPYNLLFWTLLGLVRPMLSLSVDSSRQNAR